MALQMLKASKVQRARDETGLNLAKLRRHSNRCWLGVVVAGGRHAHVEIDPVTWRWRLTRDACWSSCSTPRAGPADRYAWTPDGSEPDYLALLEVLLSPLALVG